MNLNHILSLIFLQIKKNYLPNLSIIYGIIIHHDTSNNNQLKGILKNNNCLKILATNNNSVISKNYDYVLKLPTSIDEINNIIEGSIAKERIR